MIFEFIHGVSLDQLIRKGPTNPVLVASIIQDVALGLSAAHGAGVVHRDIKPANVMITPDDHIKLIDFGVADQAGSLVLREGQVPSDIAGPGETGICGTRVYAAPEQNQGRPATPAADVYSLGILAYELCAGKRLFTDGDVMDVLRLQAGLQTALDRSEQIHPNMPVPLARVVHRTLQLLPQDRYPSAVEMLPDMGEALAQMGGIDRNGLHESKRTALLDLTDSLLLQAQAAMDQDDLELATSGFARVLALEPPNRERIVRRIRDEVRLLFWKSSRIGLLPVRLLDMLDELGLDDLRFLLEHRLAHAAGKTAEGAFRRLCLYLARWPRSASMLRAAVAASGSLEDRKEAELTERLGDVLMELGEPVAALRCYQDSRSLRPLSSRGSSMRERQARLAAEVEVRPAADFHRAMVKSYEVETLQERAEIWRKFLLVHPDYRPAMAEAVEAYRNAGDAEQASRLATNLGRRAFVAGAVDTAKSWLRRAVMLDPSWDEALLYLAELHGGVPEGDSVRNQRVKLLRRLGMTEAALAHREKELTGGERDIGILEEMAEIAEEWGKDSGYYLVRKGCLEIQQGLTEAAQSTFLDAIKRSRDPRKAACLVLDMPGIESYLSQEVLAQLQAVRE
jgi:tetratricopeptide (TPR) repeat protein